jgi:hypothetical protein
MTERARAFAARGWRVLALWLGFCCMPRAALALQQSARVLPEGLIVLSWPAGTSRVVDATSAIRLESGEVLLVPAEPGDSVRVRGEHGELPVLGLATGQLELPDVITWDPSLGGELRLPGWTTSHFVAARLPGAGWLTVEVAARAETPLAWLDWDRAVATALRGGAAPGLPEGSAAERSWRGLSALLAALPATERRAAADLLQLFWLEQALRVRPLVGPYFTRDTRYEFSAPREFHAGERFELSAPEIDVLRWQLVAFGDARVVLREGDAVSRELSWNAPQGLAPGVPPIASRPRSIRVVPPAQSGRVSLEVLQGKITLEQSAYVQREEFHELLAEPVRRRLRLLRRAQRAAPAWVRAVAGARATRSGQVASLVELADGAPAGDLRAWLLLEAAQTEPQSRSAVALADRALSAAGTPTLEILALQHRRDVEPPASAGVLPPAPLGSVAKLELKGRAASEEQLWLLALHGRDALAPGMRPAWGGELERWLGLRREDREVWTTVSAFWRSIPLRSVLPSPGALTSAEYVPLEPGVDCPLPGAAPDSMPAVERFDRWLFPAPGTTLLSADVRPQHFVPLLFKPLAPEPVPETSISLDATSVPLHSAAGLSSEVAIGAGVHALQVPADALPLAVRLSEGVMAPCEWLRRVRTWTELSDGASADFELPGAGAMSVVRISLAPAGLPASVPAQELEVSLGRRQLSVWGRGARTGASEIRVEPADALLSLRGRGAAARARVELRRAPDVAEAAPAPSAAAPAQHSAPPPGDFESSLVRLRELGHSLRAARGEAAISELHGQRARLLDALGFKELALRDAAPEPPGEREDTWLPAEARTVVPVSLSSKIGPLSLPQPVAELTRRRERLRVSGCASFNAETEPPRELGADAESLLLGYCAEQNGLPLLAARAYEAIGRAQPNGAALARAAALLADQSLDTGEPSFALRSRLLASRAAALGEDASGLLARLGPAFEWVVPNAYERAAGFATVTLTAPPNPTPGTRVRRALVDAPELALLIEGDSAVQIGVKLQRAEALQLELGCEDPSDLACRPELRRDGERFDCPRDRASPGSCAMPLLPGDHQVELRLPGQRALGWVKATLGGKLVPIRLSSRWIEVESEEPAQITVRGPTIVILESRGTGGAGEKIAWESCGEDEPIRNFELPSGVDPGALRIGETAALGAPLRVELPIETEGPCTMRFGPCVGRALFRLSVARAQGLPKPRVVSWVEPEAPPPPPAPPQFAEALVAREPELPPRGPEGVPALVLGRSRLVASSRSLDEEGPRGLQTPSSSFLEASALLAREIWPARFWGFGQAGMRFRSGPPSVLGRIFLDMPASAGVPGVQFNSEGYWQTVQGFEAFSWRSTGTLSWLFELTRNLNLTPKASYTLDREPLRPGDLSVTDADVYSPYREKHWHYLNLELNASWRPLVDGLGKAQLEARPRPDFSGIDRTGLSGAWLFLPLSGINTLVELDAGTSYRPLGPDRSRSFMRQSAGLGVSWWRWFTNSERIRVFGRVDGTFDAPAGPLGASVYAVELGVEVSASGDRGLSDLSPSSLPFLDFQERGRALPGNSGERP